MREIKFRVWHKEKKEMLKPTFIAVNNLDNVLYYDTLADEWFRIKNPENLALMQYTGLRDMNGKEIYEGDILEDAKGQYGKVFYKTSTASFAVNWRMRDGSYMTDECFYGVVVGNIFENPELLKEYSNETNKNKV